MNLRALLLTALLAATALFGVRAAAEERAPAALQGITIDEKLGEKAAIDAVFTDQSGRQVRIADYLSEGVPVILTLNYYRCKTLCGVQLQAVLTGLKALDWTPGDKFQVVTVSIDPREGPELAREKRASYLEDYGRGPDVAWSFLTGDEESIEALADSVGFRYRYIEDEDQYAHPAAAIFLAPDGTVTRYLTSLTIGARDLRFALIEASDGKVGTPIDQFIFSCYRFDYVGGKYTPFAFGVMRAAGTLTVIGLVLLLALLFRSERQRTRLMETPT